MTLAAGTRIGAYEITGALGAGGMGEVYRARDTRLQRDVAIKMLPASLAEDAPALERFHREAHAKNNPDAHLPVPTLATLFEVVTCGRVYRGKGAALQRWIAERRQEWKGPKGFLFSQRPTL
jgi:hypothetical protein